MFLDCDKSIMSMCDVVKAARRKSRLVAAMRTVYGDDTVPGSPTVEYINSFRQAQDLLKQQHMLMPASACADRDVRTREGAIHSVEKRSALAHRRGSKQLCVSLDMQYAGGWPGFVMSPTSPQWNVEEVPDDILDEWLVRRRAWMAQMRV
jgi:hypothetical protein